MLMLDHLENRERVYEAMNECSRTEHYWILFRKYYHDTFDTWYGVMRYGDSFMHIAGKVYEKAYAPQPIHFSPNTVTILPTEILSGQNRAFGQTGSEVLKDWGSLDLGIHRHQKDNYIPFGFQYLNVKRPVDMLTESVEQVNWTPNLCTGIDKKGNCVFKLPSVEMTYKLGHMVVFEEWYQQNKAKHLVLS